LAASTLFIFGSGPAAAEKPDWTPVSELLVVSISQSNPLFMSEIMTRCTALNMLLAGLTSQDAPTVSQRYQAEAERFVQNAVLIDSNIEKEMTGQNADISNISDVIIEKVKGQLGDYNDWMDENLATSDSPFSTDFDLEMESCSLAS